MSFPGIAGRRGSRGLFQGEHFLTIDVGRVITKRGWKPSQLRHQIIAIHLQKKIKISTSLPGSSVHTKLDHFCILASVSNYNASVIHFCKGGRPNFALDRNTCFTDTMSVCSVFETEEPDFRCVNLSFPLCCENREVTSTCN